MPGFRTPGAAQGPVGIVRDRLLAFYDGGGGEPVPTGALLAQIPLSHHRTFIATYFRGAADPGSSGEEERRAWTRSRLAALAPGRTPDSLVVVTERLSLIGVDTVVAPLSRNTLDLRAP